MSEQTIAEQFDELETLCSTTDIYNKTVFEPFSFKNVNAVGKGFDFRNYMLNSNDLFWEKNR